MTAQRKTSRRRSSSSKDEEFERLLRRAALYAKRHPNRQIAQAPAAVVSITRRKRVKAA
jgi:hypothetical protein